MENQFTIELKKAPRYVGRVRLSDKQVDALIAGEAVWIENMQNKKGKTFSSWYTWDVTSQSGKFHNRDPKEVAQVAESTVLLKNFGGVELTPEQALNLKEGKTILLKNAVSELTGEVNDVFLSRNPQTQQIEVRKKTSTQSIDSKEIKKISIRDYLAKHGYEPQKISGSKLWYHSPLREEHTPSFQVDTNTNTFKDFGGDGIGGSIIDLAMALHGVDFKEALNALSKETTLPVIQLKPANTNVSVPKITITDTRNLENKALLNYLQYERCIDLDVAKEFCKEVHFKIKKNDGSETENFAIGFPNVDGNFELRNKYFKGCNAKNISTVNNNTDTRKRETVCVFEGFMDYLSYLSYKKQIGLNVHENAVILNSVALYNTRKEDILNFIGTHRNVNLFLDNDDAGRRVRDDIMEACEKMPQIMTVYDSSLKVYSYCKDYNEYWMNLNESQNSKENVSTSAKNSINSRQKQEKPVVKKGLKL